MIVPIVLGLAMAIGHPYSDVQIDKAYEPYLLSEPLLMEASGAKIIRLENGDRLLVAVASTILRDSSAKERLRAETVCRTKALASVVAEKQGVQIAHTERVAETTRVVLDGQKETAKSISELFQTTTAKVEGLAPDLPVIGRWKSKKGDVFYLAIGTQITQHGHPLRRKDPK